MEHLYHPFSHFIGAKMARFCSFTLSSSFREVTAWLVDSFLQHNAFFVIFFKQRRIKQLLDSVFVIS